jgi:hypothetical protein
METNLLTQIQSNYYGLPIDQHGYKWFDIEFLRLYFALTTSQMKQVSSMFLNNQDWLSYSHTVDSEQDDEVTIFSQVFKLSEISETRKDYIETQVAKQGIQGVKKEIIKIKV